MFSSFLYSLQRSEKKSFFSLDDINISQNQKKKQGYSRGCYRIVRTQKIALGVFNIPIVLWSPQHI